MRRGFTLIEILLVLALMGILALIAAPRTVALGDALALRGEVDRLIGALDAARGVAVRLGSTAALTLDDSGYVITTATTGSPDQVRWRAAGPASRGLRLSGSGSAILFGAAGIAVGASNRTLILTRGTLSRRVVISRLGRISW